MPQQVLEAGGVEFDAGATLAERCRNEPDTVRAEVLGAVSAHHVAFLLGYPTSVTDLQVLVAALGVVSPTVYSAAEPGAPGVVRIRRSASAGGEPPYGWHWHSDASFLAAPPTYSILLAVEAGPGCGDTVWADQVRAFATLSPRLQDLLRRERAVHEPLGWDPVRATHARDVARRSLPATGPTGSPAVTHPVVVRTTGDEEALYINQSYTTGLAGWQEWESLGLLQSLFHWQVRDEFVCRRAWEPGLVAVWDNRAVVHRALDGRPGARRELLRATFESGDAPAPPQPASRLAGRQLRS
jgi:taurine dioxygenase